MYPPLLTLTTDYGNVAPDAGLLLGSIATMLPQFKVIEITHNITKYNHLEAAFVLKNCINRFPNGSVHLVDVADDKKLVSSFLLVDFCNQFLVVPDNGMIGLLLYDYGFDKDSKIEAKVWRIDYSDKLNMQYLLDAVLPILAAIDWRAPDLLLGDTVTDYLLSKPLLPFFSDEQISASITYIDQFGNLYLNLHHHRFLKVVQKKQFEFYLRGVKIKKIVQFPAMVGQGDFFATFSDVGLIMIGNFGGNAANLLGMVQSDKVIINIYDN